MPAENHHRINMLIDRHFDDLFVELDGMGATPADLEAMHETDLAEAYENWLAEASD